MTPRTRFLAITIALLGFLSVRPATVTAQPPAYLLQWGSAGSGPGQFNVPYAIAVDAEGYVYVTDINNHRVQKFAPES